MLFNIPLAILFGIFTIISLFITFSLGMLIVIYRKPLLKKHQHMAYLTVALSIVHLIFVILLWSYGITI